MDVHAYRDMHLLDEITRSPEVTQRELSKRIGVALGLTNLMLRRLAKKGYLKIKGTRRSRIRYLITPNGIMEKTRLTYEFVQYSLQLYHRVRHFWREQLASVAKTGQRRILLFGEGELAEIAFLTIREMGLQFIGATQETADHRRFLGYPLHAIRDVAPESYDWILVASLNDGEAIAERLVALGQPRDRILIPLRSGPPLAVSERGSVAGLPTVFPAATVPTPVTPPDDGATVMETSSAG